MQESIEYNVHDLDLQEIKKRTVKGVAILTIRTFFLQVVTFLSYGFYSALFAPEQLGTYALVVAAKNFLGYFSDIGLAASLLQKKEQIKEEDLRTTFIVQQVLVFFLLCLLLFATPYLRVFYNLNDDAIWLLWALGFSLLLSSLKTIPSVLLERRLDFVKLAIPQMIEALLFGCITLFLASRGGGLASFTVAIIVSSIVGFILIYWLQPWMPKLLFSKSSLNGLLKFGIPYQANTLLAVIKDDGMTLLLGKLIGLGNIGLLDWSRKWGLAPLRFFMDQVIKVTFPAFARMQDNKEELKKALTQAIFFVCFLVFPSLAGLVLLSPLIIQVVPRYKQWEPALFALSMFAVNAGWAAVTTPLTNVLNSLGKIKVTFWLMVMWTALTWILVPLGAHFYGINGVATAYALLGASSVVAIIIARKYAPFDLVYSVFRPLIAAVGMAIVLFIVRWFMSPSLQWILILIVFGLLTYVLGIILLVGPNILASAKKFLLR